MGRQVHNILVVDDEQLFRQTLQKILEDAGFAVLAAENGGSAMRLAAEHAVDVVLLDVKLPDMSGIEVLERVRALKPALSVIMMVAYEDEMLIRQAFVQGAYSCLPKPFDISTLMDLLTKLKDE